MRDAVRKAYGEVTGTDEVFLFSGWGGELDVYERACVEDREPEPQVTDTERIEYLEAHPAAFGFNVEAGGWGFEFDSPYFRTLRECIDHQILRLSTGDNANE